MFFITLNDFNVRRYCEIMINHKNYFCLGNFHLPLAPNKRFLQATKQTATGIYIAVRLSTVQCCHVLQINNFIIYFGFCIYIFKNCVVRLFDHPVWSVKIQIYWPLRVFEKKKPFNYDSHFLLALIFHISEYKKCIMKNVWSYEQ